VLIFSYLAFFMVDVFYGFVSELSIHLTTVNSEW